MLSIIFSSRATHSKDRAGGGKNGFWFCQYSHQQEAVGCCQDPQAAQDNSLASLAISIDVHEPWGFCGSTVFGDDVRFIQLGIWVLKATNCRRNAYKYTDLTHYSPFGYATLLKERKCKKYKGNERQQIRWKKGTRDRIPTCLSWLWSIKAFMLWFFFSKT